MLLELLSDFQITIPELGRIEARTHPVVLLTSNNSRELTEALKRRCLYLWLDYPELEHELEIVRLHAPELSETVARRLVEVIGMVRDARPEEAALDRRVDRLGARAAAARRTGHRRRHLQRDDVGDRQAPHRHGHGRRAGRAEAALARRCRLSATTGCRPASSSSARSCAAKASRSAPRRCSTPSRCCARSSWTSKARLPRGARGDARQEPGGPARLRARVRSLLLPPGRGSGPARGRQRGRVAWRLDELSEDELEALRRADRSSPARRLGGRHARPRPARDRRAGAPRRRARA